MEFPSPQSIPVTESRANSNEHPGTSIFSLPPELLGEIIFFALLIEEEDGERLGEWPLRYYRLVCKRWAAAIEEIPALWSFIPQTNIGDLELALRKSGVSPLRIRFAYIWEQDWPSRDFCERFASMVVEHSGRWESIILHSVPAGLPFVNRFLSASAPNIIEISLMNLAETPLWEGTYALLETPESLRHLCLQGPLRLPNPSVLHGVRLLELIGAQLNLRTPEAFADIISQCHNLRYFTIERCTMWHRSSTLPSFKPAYRPTILRLMIEGQSVPEVIFILSLLELSTGLRFLVDFDYAAGELRQVFKSLIQTHDASAMIWLARSGEDYFRVSFGVPQDESQVWDCKRIMFEAPDRTSRRHVLTEMLAAAPGRRFGVNLAGLTPEYHYGIVQDLNPESLVFDPMKRFAALGSLFSGRNLADSGSPERPLTHLKRLVISPDSYGCDVGSRVLELVELLSSSCDCVLGSVIFDEGGVVFEDTLDDLRELVPEVEVRASVIVLPPQERQAD